MKRKFVLFVALALLMSFPSCAENTISEKTTVTENVSETVPVLDEGMSIDEIVSFYNDTIKNAEKLTREYVHISLDDLSVSSGVIEEMASAVLKNAIKSNDEPLVAYGDEASKLLPKPVLSDSHIKEYVNSDGEVSLYLYDFENPEDEGVLKFYTKDSVNSIAEQNGLSIKDMKLDYTDCKIEITIDANTKKIQNMSYSWKAFATGNIELMLATHSFGVQIGLKEAYSFI